MIVLERPRLKQGSRFLALHALLGSLGLLALLSRLSTAVFRAWLLTPPRPAFHDWSRPFFFPDKPQVLVYYLLALAGLGLYHLGVYVLLRRPTASMERFASALSERRGAAAAYALAAVAAAALLLTPESLIFTDPQDLILYFFAWSAFVLLPLCSDERLQLSRRSWSRAVAGALLLALLLQLAWMFGPFLSGSVPVEAEYLDIPIETRVAGRFVDNTDFINGHDLLGWRKYKPETDQGRSPALRPGLTAPLKDTAALRAFVSRRDGRWAYEGGLLVAEGPMSPGELEELLRLCEPAERQAVQTLFYSSRKRFEEQDRRVYTPEEIEFFQKNHVLWARQLGGKLLHHHNFMLQPILQYALGKPASEISLQYGWLNTVLMARILEAAGGVTFQGYFRLLYSFYPLYYLLFLAAAYAILGSAVYALAAGVLAYGFLLLLGFESILLAPGFNPARHLLDLAIPLLLLPYFKRRSLPALALALSAASLAILSSREFGLFMLLAALVAVVAFILHEGGSWRDWALTSLFGAAGLAVFALAPSGRSLMTRYYLEGVGTTPPHPWLLQAIVLSLAAAYGWLLKAYETRDPRSHLAAFFFLYVQANLVYFVWNMSSNHLLVLAPPMVLGALLLLKLLLNRPGWKEHESACLSALISLGLLAFYLPALATYACEVRTFRGQIDAHRLHRWELDRAQFSSTMPPGYFSESAGLIESFEPRKSVFLISKYDNLLPLLAGKYPGLPFDEASWFLLTPKETQLCIDSIRQAEPEHLFVDTDIRRSLFDDVLAPNEPLMFAPGPEMLARARRLRELRRVFAAVENDYVLEKKGLLISVYRRRGPAKGAKA